MAKVAKLKITFDVDNVLADSMDCWCRKATKYLGSPVLRADIKSHKIVGSVPMPATEIFRLQDEVWKEWENLPPTESNLSQKLTTLKDKGFGIYIATSRPSRSIEFVKQWLNKMRIPYDDFYPLGPYKPKVKVPSDALVDDAPDQIQKFIRTNRLGFLYKQPWNSEARIPKAVAIDSLDDLLEYFRIVNKSL